MNYFKNTEEIIFQILWDVTISSSNKEPPINIIAPLAENCCIPVSNKYDTLMIIISHTSLDRENNPEDGLSDTPDVGELMSMCKEKRIKDKVNQERKVFIPVA